MQFDRSEAYEFCPQDDTTCEQEFGDLMAQIDMLAASARGVTALTLSARLLEVAAFELAGRISCDEVGQLIETAAKLADKTAILNHENTHSRPVSKQVLQ